MPDKNENQQNKQQQTSILRGVAAFSHIGLTMAACIFIGVFLGKFLDGRLGTSPGLLILFSLLGMASAFVALFRLAKRR